MPSADGLLCPRDLDLLVRDLLEARDLCEFRERLVEARVLV